MSHIDAAYEQWMADREEEQNEAYDISHHVEYPGPGEDPVVPDYSDITKDNPDGK